MQYYTLYFCYNLPLDVWPGFTLVPPPLGGELLTLFSFSLSTEETSEKLNEKKNDSVLTYQTWSY